MKGVSLSLACRAIAFAHLLHCSHVRRVGTHGASNRDIHLYTPDNSSSIHLATISEVRRSGRITNGMQSGWATLRDSVLLSSTPARTLLEWSFRKQRGSGLTAYAPVSDVSVLVCTDGACPPLRPVSVPQKNKPSTVLSSNVQSINLPVDCTAWRFCMLRHDENGCATPSPRHRAAKQWFERTGSSDDNAGNLATWLFSSICWKWVWPSKNNSQRC